MIELLVGGALVFAALVVLGVLWVVVSLVFTLVILPFKLLEFLFHGAAALLLVPFFILLGLIGLFVFGAGMVALLVPAMPLVLLGLGIWWLMKRRQRNEAPAPQGTRVA